MSVTAVTLFARAQAENGVYFDERYSDNYSSTSWYARVLGVDPHVLYTVYFILSFYFTADIQYASIKETQ